MGSFLLRRLAGHTVLALVAVSFAYLLAAAALHPCERSAPPPAASAGTYRGADEPLVGRYRAWATGVLHGDFGRTLDGEPVAGELWRRLWVSARLLLAGTVLGCAGGVLLGVYAAARRDAAPDRLITAGTFLLLAVPVFVLAVLAQLAATELDEATGVRVVAWAGEPGGTFGALGRTADGLRHLALPTAVVALSQLAVYCRYQRGMTLDVLDADHVRTARAKGLRRRDALLRHGLRAALVPMTTYFAYTAGLALLTGVFTERVFGWHGLGEWVVTAIVRGDVNVVAAANCVAAVAVVLAGLASDAVRCVLDPRVRTPAP
ncbi:Dipeptide transport system permease protein DppB [Actinomadura rubteroloni]|uniref:Dipeptide transport system permease protein DppB n=1 Tax=Actinomadura rubteroloni TaxID=1926885 RepID=A0A2P4UH93_9ACTN|nr:ABC transporter permease [Actinomadura rubteroloni]POM24376.1 Dipeptide transport system permease protein DppB [Actinomadura rubteroloni]